MTDETINTENVLDINSKKESLMPFQLRAVILAQYIESKEANHSAEAFVAKMEDRLTTLAATTAVDFVRKAVKEVTKQVR